MFGWPVADTTRAVVERQITADTSFEEFLIITLTALNFVLHELSLRVHDYILAQVKTEVEAAFEALRAELERRVGPRSYAVVNSRIADAIPAVQAAIDRVAEWFVPVQRKDETTYRTLEQIVDIGIESARRMHPGFLPVIERQVEDILIRYDFLWDFTDVILTVIDNVYRHSGTNSPWIHITVGTVPLDGPTRRIVVRVESEVTAQACSPEAHGRLARIKERIQSADYRQHVNLEGGTGLLKLNRLVSRDARQSLDYDFTEARMFFVQVDLIRQVFKVDETPAVAGR
jgi:hypothetical protein